MLNTALNDRLLLHYDVHVNPDTVTKDLIQFLVGVGVFGVLSASELTPEALRAPVAVPGQGSGAHSQLRGWVLSCLFLLLCQDSMGTVETVFELIN